MPAFRWSIFAAAASVVAPVGLGCGDDESGGAGGSGNSCAGMTCTACDPYDFTHPIQVRVRDAVTTVPIDDAQVSSDSVPCISSPSSLPGWYLCEADASGVYLVRVDAQGYASVSFDVTVTAATGCCSCGLVTEPVYAELQPS